MNNNKNIDLFYIIIKMNNNNIDLYNIILKNEYYYYLIRIL